MSLLLLLFFSAVVFAQSVSITGKVSEKNGDPLPVANVVLEGTKKVASTDLNGNYIYEIVGRFQIYFKATQRILNMRNVLESYFKLLKSSALKPQILTNHNQYPIYSKQGKMNCFSPMMIKSYKFIYYSFNNIFNSIINKII